MKNFRGNSNIIFERVSAAISEFVKESLEEILQESLQKSPILCEQFSVEFSSLEQFLKKILDKLLEEFLEEFWKNFQLLEKFWRKNPGGIPLKMFEEIYKGITRTYEVWTYSKMIFRVFLEAVGDYPRNVAGGMPDILSGRTIGKILKKKTWTKVYSKGIFGGMIGKNHC